MKAGTLRHRITVQEQVTELDSSGDRETMWTDFADLWAAIEPISVREFISAQSEQSKVSARIIIRPYAGLNASMRILHGDKTYNIEGMFSDKESGQDYLTLAVSEGVRRD